MTSSQNAMAFVYTTINDNANAQQIVKTLLQKKLIACANICNSVQSFYVWNGEINCDNEVVIILKTNKALVDVLCDELKKLHPYDVPCIIELGVNKVHNKAYLDWIIESTSILS